MVAINQEVDHYLVLKKDLRGLVDRGLIKPAPKPEKLDRRRDTIEAFECSFVMGLRARELVNQGKSVAVVRPNGDVEVIHGDA